MNTSIITATDPLIEAQQQIKRLTDLHRQASVSGLTLTKELTPAKKYQVYASALLQMVQQPGAGALLTDPQPLPASTAALVARLQQHATAETTLRAPNLAVLAASQGEETVQRLVGVVLRQFTESVNVKNCVSLFQLHEMSLLVPLEFADLSLTDLVLCLRQVKAGQYGPLYESFDTVKLGEFLRKYRAEKAAYQAQKHVELKYSPCTALQDLMTGLEQAPAHIRQSMKELSAGAIATHVGEVTDLATDAATQRPVLGVNVDQVLREAQKPKPKMQRPKPLTEREYTQQIMTRLMPYLDVMQPADYDYYIDHYRSFRQEQLASWLEREKQQRQTNGWPSAA